MNRQQLELKGILSSGEPLLISEGGLRSALSEVIPGQINPNISMQELQPAINGTGVVIKTYKEMAAELLSKEIIPSINSRFDDIYPDDEDAMCLTDDYSNDELPSLSIAYYRIFGFISASSWWRFSTKQFEKDLLAAEANDAIKGHFLHINSPGGEAWYLDRISETMRTLKKPVFALLEQTCASAAYYIGCHANKIMALTQNDQIGCIGVISDFWISDGYFEQLGFKHIVVRSSQSPLKNKETENLYKGKSEAFQKNRLDPIATQFIQEVRDMRPKLKALPDDAPVIQGETFSATNAAELGLIDGTMTFLEAIQAAAEMARTYSASLNGKFNEALKFIPS